MEAPKHFEFTVKAHQDISHRFRLAAKKECLEAFERMREIYNILRTCVLLIQTHGSFKPSPNNLKQFRRFFRVIDRDDLTLIWETRGSDWERLEVKSKLAKALADLDVSHVTDPFRTMPAHTEGLAYFCLHGLGSCMYYYQYSDGEMVELFAKLKDLEEDVYVLFNNLAMWDDAQRFQHYIRKGSFPRLTKAVGLDSALEVLQKTRYPVSKAILTRKVGWRLIEWREGEQIPLAIFLKKIPNKSYSKAEEVIEEIKKKRV